MTIRVRFMGQLGNQLFQHCIGKVIADRTGLRYRPPTYFLDKRGNPVRWSGEPLFVMRPSDGRRGEGPLQDISVNHWIDLAALDCNRPIRLKHGYYQRYELYRDYNQRIREDWLKIPEHRFVPTDDEAVYIHCRRTDYVPHVDNPNDPTRHCLAASIEDYAKCLEQFPCAKRLVIVTDDPRDKFHSEFDKLGLPWTISGKSWDEDFLVLASCRRLVICQSTFSWWAGFLGRAEKIVCSVTFGTFWNYGIGLYGPASPDYPNLYVDDEPERWTWIQ